MSNGAYAGLRMAARAGKPDPDPETPDTPEENSGQQKDTDMTEDEHKAAVAEAETKARAEGFAAANARFAKVTASEHYAGREALAHQLLGNAKLEADEIVESLAKAEKKPAATELSKEEKRAAAEEGGRKEMKAALAETGNSNIDPNGGGKTKDGAAQSASVWDSAYAGTIPNYKAA